MHTLAARRGALLLVVILLVISILLEQAVAGLCPWLGQLGGVRPMIVFLDIPLEAPVTIDWLPVGFLFILFYSLVGAGRDADKPKGEIRSRGWFIFWRWWLLLIFILLGGGLFYLVSGFLPRAVRNGVDSFGIRADLILPYPSGQTVHLQGSMVMLACVVLGWRLLINSAAPRNHAAPRKAVVPAGPPGTAVAPNPPAPGLTGKAVLPVRKPVIATEPAIPVATGRPVRGRIAMQIAEPIEVGYAMAGVEAPRVRLSYPCVVEGGIKPLPARRKEPSTKNGYFASE